VSDLYICLSSMNPYDGPFYKYCLGRIFKTGEWLEVNSEVYKCMYCRGTLHKVEKVIDGIPLIKKEFVVPARLPMRSAVGEQQQFKYQRFRGKSGRNWFIPINIVNRAEYVYVDNPDKREEGFGGRNMPFELEDGETYVATGPWLSNSDAFYADTGVDVRREYETYGCIALGRKTRGTGSLRNRQTVFENVLYYDLEPTLGDYHRIHRIGFILANLYNVVVYYRMNGSSGPIYPMSHEKYHYQYWMEESFVEDLNILCNNAHSKFKENMTEFSELDIENYPDEDYMKGSEDFEFDK